MIDKANCRQFFSQMRDSLIRVCDDSFLFPSRSTSRRPWPIQSSTEIALALFRFLPVVSRPVETEPRGQAILGRVPFWWSLAVE